MKSNDLHQQICTSSDEKGCRRWWEKGGGRALSLIYCWIVTYTRSQLDARLEDFLMIKNAAGVKNWSQIDFQYDAVLPVENWCASRIQPVVKLFSPTRVCWSDGEPENSSPFLLFLPLPEWLIARRGGGHLGWWFQKNHH